MDIDLATGLPCHRCGDMLTLLAQIPHSFIRSDGQTVEGRRGIGLCASCDRTDPAAQGLLAYFAVHDNVTEDTVSDVAALIIEWADRIGHRTIAQDIEQAADDDYRRWEAGEL